MNFQSVPVMPMQHIVKTQPYTLDELERLFQSANELQPVLASRRHRHTTLNGCIMASLFYEPSTRTRLSFESAMLRLGGGVIGTENAKEFSSAAKGETIEDTIRVIGQYADVVVLRHYETNAAERAASVSRVPIISAGCGTGQHPTQALLDVYTIWRRFRSLKGLRVGMMGDLQNGRTVRSLAYLLSKYEGIELYFASPSELRLGQDMRMHLHEHGIKFAEYESVEDFIHMVDVLYVTRVQLERMHAEERHRFIGSYKFHGSMAVRMKEGSIIMHPLPRNDELSNDVDRRAGAVYLTEQIESGLLIRMALLQQLLT